MTQTTESADVARLKGIAKSIMGSKPVPGASRDDVLGAIAQIRLEHAEISAGAIDPARALVANANLSRRAGIADVTAVTADFIRERIAFRSQLEDGDDADASPEIKVGPRSFKLARWSSAPDPVKAAIEAIASKPLPADKDGLAQVESAFSIAGAATPTANGMTSGRFIESLKNGGSGERVFDAWEPRYVDFDNMKSHPTALIEAKTLASIKPPKPAIMPMIKQDAVTRGALSDAQLEAITLAINAHELCYERLISGAFVTFRRGFMLADGTGTGKSNSAAGIIQDSWNRGRRRHVIFVEKPAHIENFERALAMIGTSMKVAAYDDVSGPKGITFAAGAIVVSYAMARTRKDDKFPVIDALVKWMSEGEGDGVVVVDESHNLRNSPDNAHNPAGYGVDVSLQATAFAAFDEALPNVRVVYASATGATQLHNLAYMNRLVLWGPDTPYSDFERFSQKTTSSAVGLEVVPIHLKSAGMMVSRTLSLNGVSYETIMHRLTIAQADEYSAITELVSETLRMTRSHVSKWQGQKSPNSVTIKQTKVPLPNGFTGDESLLTVVRGALDRVLELAETSISMPTVLAEADAAIENGMAPVFQIAHTYEAELNRAIAAGVAERPTNFAAAIAEILRVLVVPSAGAAQRVIADLADRWDAIKPMSSPLDQIITHYGTDRVAEVTGRTCRRVPLVVGSPEAGYEIEVRANDAAQNDRAAFMDGYKTILVFSTAFGGTGYEYHASKSSRNQRQRYHIVLETGDQADIAIQGIGRTHRSGQAVPPRIALSMTDLPGDSIRNARVIRSIAKLGALSMGHREASSRSLFDEMTDVGSAAAQRAIYDTTRKILANAYGEIPVQAYNSWLASVGAEKTGMTYNADSIRFFKRLRYAPLELQKAIFARFQDNYQALPTAVRDGLLESGPHVIRQPVEVISTELIHFDAKSRERIEAHHIKDAAPAEYASFEEALEDAKFYCMAGTQPRIRMRRFDRSIAIEAMIARPDILKFDQKCWRIYTPEGVDVVSEGRRMVDGGSPVPETVDPAHLWRERIATLKAIAGESRIIVTGSILRIEPLIAQKGTNRRLVVAPTVDGSQLTGYMLAASTVDQLRLTAPEMAKTVRARELKESCEQLDKGMRAHLAMKADVSIQFLPATFIPTMPSDRSDPNDLYVVVSVPKHELSGNLLKWLDVNKFVESREVATPKVAAFLAPKAEIEDAMKAILSITSIEGFSD